MKISTGSSNSIIDISAASEKDIAGISGIYENIIRSESEGISYTGWLDGVYPTVKTAYSALERGDLFVGTVDGITVGTAVFNSIQVDCYSEGKWKHVCPDNEVMVMHTLAIDPAFRGKGYGNAFVEFYEKYALDNGCFELRIDTQLKNTPARAMYKKHGFTEIGTVPCIFNGIPDVQLVLLEKYIGK